MKYFLYTLAALFVGLKLTGYIDWAWVSVLSPLYPIVFFKTLFLAIALYVHVRYALEEKEREKTGKYKSKWQQRIDQIRLEKSIKNL